MILWLQKGIKKCGQNGLNFVMPWRFQSKKYRIIHFAKQINQMQVLMSYFCSDDFCPQIRLERGDSAPLRTLVPWQAKITKISRPIVVIEKPIWCSFMTLKQYLPGYEDARRLAESGWGAAIGRDRVGRGAGPADCWDHCHRHTRRQHDVTEVSLARKPRKRYCVRQIKTFCLVHFKPGTEKLCKFYENIFIQRDTLQFLYFPKLFSSKYSMLQLPITGSSRPSIPAEPDWIICQTKIAMAGGQRCC